MIRDEYSCSEMTVTDMFYQNEGRRLALLVQPRAGMDRDEKVYVAIETGEAGVNRAVVEFALTEEQTLFLVDSLMLALIERKGRR